MLFEVVIYENVLSSHTLVYWSSRAGGGSGPAGRVIDTVGFAPRQIQLRYTAAASGTRWQFLWSRPRNAIQDNIGRCPNATSHKWKFGRWFAIQPPDSRPGWELAWSSNVGRPAGN
jgi:hypothetical protein